MSNNSQTRGRRSRPNTRHFSGGAQNQRNNFNRSGGNQNRSNRSRSQHHGQTIDPRRFVNTATNMAAEVPFVPEHAFSDFDLLPNLQATLVKRGYTAPTPIQDGAIEPILAGRDVVGLANTGTGKTAAFILPLIQRLKTGQIKQNVLIIAPTRELAMQINDEFRLFARDMQLYSALCVGGVNVNRQISELNRRPQVVVGTPGRLRDLVEQGALRLDQVGALVLDEADRMLDMGFIRDIRYLIAKLPQHRQTLCFSATISNEIRKLLDDLLTDPLTISVRSRETSDHVEQDIVYTDGKEHKIAKLEELLRQPDFGKVLIFGQTKWGVQRLADTLTKDGIPAVVIHGNKSQPQRQRALQTFKDGKVSVLVATDVAARGLDIPHVSHVINFDQPPTYDDYIHRIGRTGRAGNSGKALTFV